MVLEELKEILCNEFDVDEETITLNSSLEEDLGIDSETDIIDLVMSVEDEFGIEVPDEALENISTVGALVNYIEENID